MPSSEIEYILTHLKKAVEVKSKDEIREFYAEARNKLINANREFLESTGSRIIEKYFANGKDIEIDRIEPGLIPVTDEETNNIFKTARFWWSIPYSEGYGRRLRFLVMDRYNGKLIGILGLQSPIIGLEARNNWIGFEKGYSDRKMDALNRTMDIYTLGALPPYNFLLGGKLMVLTAVAREIRDTYKQKYGGTTTIINGRKDDGELVLLTTTSAFGKSSIYNRVKYKGHTVCIPVGYTKGIGYAYIPPDILESIRCFLERRGIKVQAGYGAGPNYRFRLLSRFLTELRREGILVTKEEILQQGYQKEVYVFPLAKNCREYLLGRDDKIEYFNWEFAELAEYWKKRYLFKRTETNHEWRTWDKTQVLDDLVGKYQLSFGMCY